MAIEKVYLNPLAEPNPADLAALDAVASAKLAAIEEGAEVNVGEEFTTTEQTKLSGIAAGAEVNPADLAALDAAANTKLTGIEAGAEVNPADLDGVPDSATRKAMADTEKTKLAGVEADATADQTGDEVRDLVVALPDDDRKIIVTRPTTGQKKIYAVQTHTDGTQEFEQSDTPES